ncbi:MAG: hypothetical protein IIC36_10145 [Gemmatimonadetes bacterium]|nr:hypothetical protein [Gemmatimonadota bacterium]
MGALRGRVCLCYKLAQIRGGRNPRVLVSPTLLTAETLKKAEAGRDLEEFETAEELFQDLES